MTTLFSSLVSDQLVHAIGWTLLHSLWQGVCVGLAVWMLVRWVVPLSAQVRYALLMGALLVIFGAACVTFGLLYTAPAVAVAGAEGSPTVAAPVSLPDIHASAEPLVYSWHQLAATFRVRLESFVPWIVPGWMLGMLVLAIRLVGGLWCVSRLRQGAPLVSTTDWQVVVDRLCRRMGIQQPVRVIESARVRVPAAIGYFKPLILIPVGTLTGLSSQQIEAILAHELAHIVRNDYGYNIFQSLMETLFFFHPIVWWLSAAARQEREHCCDDMAVQFSGNSLVYAQALTTLELNQQMPRLSMAIHGHQSSLLRRIRRLLRQPSPRPAWTEGVLAAGLLLMTLFVFSTQAFSGVQNTPEPQQQVTAITPPETITYYGTFTDTNKVVREIIIIKDKSGQVQEVYIDGKKLSKAELKNYKEVIEAKLRRAEEDTVALPVPAGTPVPELEEMDPVDPADIEVGIVPPAPPAPPACPVVPPAPPVPMEPSGKMMELEDKMEAVNDLIERLMEKHPYNEDRLADLTQRLQQLSRQHALAAEQWQKNHQQEMTRMLQEQAIDIRVFEQDVTRQAFADHLRAEAEQRQVEQERRQQERKVRVAPRLGAAARIYVVEESFSDKLVAKLIQDGWIKDEKNYTIRFRSNSLRVDGKELPEEVLEQYKTWIEEMGKDKVELDIRRREK